jgi:hypothetical protein
MNDTNPSDEMAGASREDILAALFANMVIQQTNMTMMLLGKVAHPSTGKIMQDLESAKLFIDQLEMLEVKTKGNLTKPEEELLKEALTAVRLAFVEVIDKPEAAQNAAAPEIKPSEAPAAPMAAPESSAASDESKKKFSKKY